MAAKRRALDEIDEAALCAVQDRCIVEAIQMQETADLELDQRWRVPAQFMGLRLGRGARGFCQPALPVEISRHRRS